MSALDEDTENEVTGLAGELSHVQIRQHASVQTKCII